MERAKVDEYRREDKPWPRAEKLGDCLRASVVVEGAEQVVAAYEALAKDDIFKVVRLKNKLAERVKPFNLLVNLAFQPPAPPGLAPLIVEVQIVPKAIYDSKKSVTPRPRLELRILPRQEGCCRCARGGRHGRRPPARAAAAGPTRRSRADRP